MTVREVLAAYGVGPVEAILPLRGGHLHGGVLVLTPGGRLVLKRYRHRCTAAVQAEHRVMTFARRGGIPVPAVLPLPWGDTVLRVRQNLWAAQQYVPGRHVPPSRWRADQVRAVGRLLGRVQRVLAPYPHPLPDRATWWDRAETEARLVQLEVCLGRPGHEAMDELFRRHVRLMRRAWEQGAAPSPGRFRHLPWQAVHGDVYHENLLFGPEDGVVLLDWERAAFRPRVWDLVRAAFLLFLAPEPEAGLEATRELAAAYRRETGAEPEELTAGADMLLAVLAHDLWKYEEHYLRGRTDADPFAAGDHRVLAWLLGHKSRLQAALRG